MDAPRSLTHTPGPGVPSTTSTWSRAPSRETTTTGSSMPVAGSPSEVSARTDRTVGPRSAPSGANGSGAGAVTFASVGRKPYVAPVSREHRSPACTATASVPTDDRNTGTLASAAASSALAPATLANTPGRRSDRNGARRHGTSLTVEIAVRTRASIRAP